MLDALHFSFFRGKRIARLGEKLSGHGALSALPLGALFGLSFRPYSAVLLFGMLIPLAVGTPVGGPYLPALYAVGTSLPVLAVALAIAFGAGAWAGHMDRIQKWERRFRRGAGLVFLGLGIMEHTGREVEFFIPAPTCTCSGPVSPREAERLSRLEMLMSEVQERFPRVEMVRYPMEDDRAYSEGLRRLASYLGEIGEEDFASRVAFSLRYVLPAVAVDGKLVAYGRVPSLEEVEYALKAGEARREE